MCFLFIICTYFFISLCSQDFIIEAMKFHLLKGDLKLQMSLISPRTKPRQPIGLPKVMLAIGGQAPKAIRCGFLAILVC